MINAPPADAVSTRQWYPLGMVETLTTDVTETLLLDRLLRMRRTGDNEAQVTEGKRALPCVIRYGYVWTTLDPDEMSRSHVPLIEEADEPDRRLVCCGSITVHASGLRVVENFLDMAHFPFVHTGVLGAEPHTEVERYTIETREAGQEIWATDCHFFQPQGALCADGGLLTEYVYRIAAPFSTLLYKTNPNTPSRKDVIALFVQPMTRAICRAHPVMFLLDDGSALDALVEFQQMIFLQDRSILENQRPVAMPLDASTEIPTLADRSSIAYRRWLKAQGVTYGAAQGA
ncbi:aromatic ring-hydroxylating dioxygenase subunit alpha [Asaia lannensis]|uniref:aromatic ring-hydroxylating dioxygenase subunit alpha n=1 Tax=Asaia lannensis TaxID=415421 RepID=UPI003872FCBA